jgi:hypothetical protein
MIQLYADTGLKDGYDNVMLVNARAYLPTDKVNTFGIDWKYTVGKTELAWNGYGEQILKEYPESHMVVGKFKPGTTVDVLYVSNDKSDTDNVVKVILSKGMPYETVPNLNNRPNFSVKKISINRDYYLEFPDSIRNLHIWAGNKQIYIVCNLDLKVPIKIIKGQVSSDTYVSSTREIK